MPIRSVKDILTSHDFLESRAKAQKHVKHEFQDYAYRLAMDLGDIQHKPLYMRLAKKFDRTMLEQAAAFALGYFKEPNKGKVFMWKLAQLRSEAERKQTKKKFDHETVMQSMAKLQSDLPSIFLSKYKQEFSAEKLANFAKLVLEKPVTRNLRPILLIGCGNGAEAKFFSEIGLKVLGIDICRKILAQAKKVAPNAKLTAKRSFLEHSYKENYFDAIYINNIWQYVPLDAEEKYFQEIKKLLKPNGFVYLHLLIDKDLAKQEWVEFDWEKKTYLRFVKHNSLLQIEKLITESGLKILKKDGENLILVCQQKTDK